MIGINDREKYTILKGLGQQTSSENALNHMYSLFKVVYNLCGMISNMTQGPCRDKVSLVSYQVTKRSSNQQIQTEPLSVHLDGVTDSEKRLKNCKIRRAHIINPFRSNH